MKRIPLRGRIAAFGLLAGMLATGAVWAATAPVPIEPLDKAAAGKKAKEESGRAPVIVAPQQPRTREEATRRAADPTDPSGALIIEPPAGSATLPLR